MRIAVAGATGRAGSRVIDVVRERGHDAVPMSRASGVDIITGKGLDDALQGVDAIIDAASGPSPDEQESIDFFGTSARNLQAAGERAGVRLIVATSIIGIDKASHGYNAGKVVQERELQAGPVPVRIVRAAQFHEFVPVLLDWGTEGDVGYVWPMRTQLVSARTVAEELVDLAETPGTDVITEIAGPREERLVEAARLVAAQRGAPASVEESSPEFYPDADIVAAGALLPNPGAKLAGPTFAEWLTRAVAVA
jgi:uncharacterized protein YbjT (DUF2867 family)